MACGVPLVATTGGAIPEVVGPDGLTARVVPPNDPGALASGILELLENPRLRDELGANGLRRVHERFTWRACAEGTAAIYEEMLAARSSAHQTPAAGRS
jgi:glycosyltransferase involved in cell wall biosynthesis